ncbi:hypothetical protein B9G69_015410 [Bdellovibrio sp. SKB1291214]|uniref:hypothetical protein n=1 Tax=Bdellovibrio sp. SKB1291214 TaxID=1732569 RepID=UPI00223EAC72|nr:hypothetical protein [Bdellovibrio sp. SKB1291214]UYL08430.1 hypothetical protein B9G69_015410 [Bdellovibrio sp. SKB1291214]
MASYLKLFLTISICLIPSFGFAKELDEKRVLCLRALQKLETGVVRVDYMDMQWASSDDSLNLIRQDEGKRPEPAWNYAQWGTDKVGSVSMEKLGGRSMPVNAVIELYDKFIAAYLDKVRAIKPTQANVQELDFTYFTCEDLIDSKTSNGKRSISDAVIEARTDLQRKFKTSSKAGATAQKNAVK